MHIKCENLCRSLPYKKVLIVCSSGSRASSIGIEARQCGEGLVASHRKMVIISLDLDIFGSKYFAVHLLGLY